MENNLEVIKQKAQRIKDWLIAVRRDLHSHPELGMEEFRTMEKISEYLSELNIAHKTKVATTGVVADIEGIDKSFTVAFRGDIDALPIQDKKTVDYASKEKGKCHACGHDVHTTIVLGIAKIFSKEPPPCNIRLIFQPAEETVGGALPMIKEGVLDKVNIIFGLHVNSNYETGVISVKYGAMNASSNDLRIKIKGKSAHGAHPSEGVDAIVISAQVISTIQTLISRSVDGSNSVAINIGVIKGGKVQNIICDLVEMEGTLRTFSPKIRKLMVEKIGNIVEGVSSAMGGVGEFKDRPSYSALINWDKAVDIIKKNGSSMLGKENVKEHTPSMGVEDFAFFVEEVPGAFFTLGVANEKKNINIPIHNGLFDIDEDALCVGVAMQILNLYESYSKKDDFPLGLKK